MSLPSNPQREQAAAVAGDPYASKKAATDAAALNYSDAVDRRDFIKSRLSVATDPAEIYRLQQELIEAEEYLLNMKNLFDLAARAEEIAFYDAIASGKIPVENKNPNDLLTDPRWDPSSPTFEGRSITDGWLGSDGRGTVNGKLITSFTGSTALGTPVDMDAIIAGRSARAEDAMEGSVLLEDLLASSRQRTLDIESQLDASRRSGNSGTTAGLESRLQREQGIFDRISSSIAQGAVSTLKTSDLACDCGEVGAGGPFSSFQQVPFKSSFGGGEGIMRGRGMLAGTAEGDDATFNPWDRRPGNASIREGLGPMSGDSLVWWDASGPAPGIQSGIFDDIIVEHVEPKLKHAYMAFFDGKLSVLKWLVKTIDRPKIDVEYLEQMRFNVKRNYPIKYNFGDLSITFWDDIHHVTITAIDDYFHGSVWNHRSVPNRGEFLMRDSVVIPKFDIVDYVMETHSALKYTFYNASLASYDFDGHDDTDDGGVHTVQVVLKIEGYSVQIL